MKVLILGGAGMLGHKLLQSFNDKFEVWATVRNIPADFIKFIGIRNDQIIQDVDINNFESVQSVISNLQPNIVINAIGVIKQLPTSKDVIQTLNINSIFPQRLTELSKIFEFRLITVSTDCVFKGLKGNYTETDEADATDLYGKSKNFGEIIAPHCLTLRTSIIGRELNTAHSLVDWFLSNRGKSVKGFKKAIYSGFPTVVFADIIADLIVNHPNLSGLYHVSSEPIDKFLLLQLVNKYYKANIEINPETEFQIDRSLNSDKFRAETGFTPKSWEEMIEIMANDQTPYDEWKK